MMVLFVFGGDTEFHRETDALRQLTQLLPESICSCTQKFPKLPGRESLMYSAS